jgi:hypothetical protein
VTLALPNAAEGLPPPRGLSCKRGVGGIGPRARAQGGEAGRSEAEQNRGGIHSLSALPTVRSSKKEDAMEMHSILFIQ